MAIREDELAAAANGINTVTTKLLAFALGATTAGLAGVFNASKLTIVVARPVPVHRVVHRPGDGRPRRHGQHLGRRRRCVRRLHDPGGPAEEHQPFFEESASRRSTSGRSTSTFNVPFVEYQFLLYGVALVLMMLLRPEGLFPSQRPEAARRGAPVAEEPSTRAAIPRRMPSSRGSAGQSR